MASDDSSTDASRQTLLKRIANILGVSTSALYGPEEATAGPLQAGLREDARAILGAFVRIRDPQRRRDCVAYVVDMMNGETDEGGAAEDDA